MMMNGIWQRIQSLFKPKAVAENLKGELAEPTPPPGQLKPTFCQAPRFLTCRESVRGSRSKSCSILVQITSLLTELPIAADQILLAATTCLMVVLPVVSL